MLAVLATVAGCKRDRCVQSQENTTSSAVTIDWKQCSDDKDRSVTCELSGAQWSCSCSVAGTKGKTFQLASDGTLKNRIVTSEIARDKCAWRFAP